MKNAENVDWRRNWISSFFIRPDCPSHEKSVEYLSYDLQDLVGDVGGYLGLFLGWSLMSICAQAPTWAKYAMNKFRVKKKQTLFKLPFLQNHVLDDICYGCSLQYIHQKKIHYQKSQDFA